MSKREYYCRKANFNDDVTMIAKYIHLTDSYIYPKICANHYDESWIKLISSCLKCRDNVFYIDNIEVVIYNGKIVGIACVIPCGNNLRFEENIDVPDAIAENVKTVSDGYFKPLIDESLNFIGYNIVNVCIDENYRGKGLGSLLMTHCVKKYEHSVLHLDVIASNAAAVSLYKKLGFEITGEYFGFSGDDTQLLCYHMMNGQRK